MKNLSQLSRRITATSRLAPLVLAALLGLGSNSMAQNAGQRIGEKLDSVGRDIKGGLNRAGEAAKEQFATAKTAVTNMGVESRVYGRLHWDVDLNGATIDLESDGKGVITLNGSVASAKAKARAVELTKTTVGVTQVVDKLAVQTPATTTRAKVAEPQP